MRGPLVTLCMALNFLPMMLPDKLRAETTNRAIELSECYCSAEVEMQRPETRERSKSSAVGSEGLSRCLPVQMT